MATSYEFDVVDDFSSGVDNAALQYQVERSLISSADVTHIDTLWKGAPTRNKCDVWFDAPLTGGDQTILDGVVADHDGAPLESVLVQQGRLAFDVEGVEVWKDGTGQLRLQDMVTSERTLAELATAGQPDLSKVVLEQEGLLVYTGDGDVVTVR